MSPDSTVWVIRLVALVVHVAVNSTKANMTAISFYIKSKYLWKKIQNFMRSFYKLQYLQLCILLFYCCV